MADEKQTSPNLLLSGDFTSPLEVMGSSTLSDAQKREVLQTWLDELDRKTSDDEAQTLRRSIEKQLEKLR